MLRPTVNREDLDGAIRNESKYPQPFQVILDVECLQRETQRGPHAWDNLPHETMTPLPCFSTASEQQKTLEVYGEYRVAVALFAVC